MPILFQDLVMKVQKGSASRAEGYAAERAGNMSLFHALLVVEQMGRLPDAFLRDRDYLRLMVDLSEHEFNQAIEVCERHEWLYWSENDPPEPLH